MTDKLSRLLYNDSSWKTIFFNLDNRGLSRFPELSKDIIDLVWQDPGKSHKYERVGPGKKWAEAWTEVMAAASQFLMEGESDDRPNHKG